ncbi:hypothetical protein Tco_0078805 [Tanacetum coccineum]
MLENWKTTVRAERRNLSKFVIDVINNSNMLSSAFTIYLIFDKKRWEDFKLKAQNDEDTLHLSYDLGIRSPHQQVYKYVCGPHASALEDSGSLHQQCLSGKTLAMTIEEVKN